jgi:DNA-binding CsgD family transcriptional regulator/tetratricopeptide (TPR) repeat protein
MVGGAPALVGRDPEVALLRGRVDDLGRGRGGAVWIEGEPGIGKSLVLHAGLSDRPDGVRVLSAVADELVQGIPLGSVLDCIGGGAAPDDPLWTELSSLTPTRSVGLTMPGNAVVAAAETVIGWIDSYASRTPIVLAIDDIQWADDMTVAVWGRLVRLAGQLPLLLVAACRPVPQRDELSRLRGTIRAADSSAIISLSPLSPPAVDTLLRNLLGSTAGPRLRGLADDAAGNPLYLEELVDALRRDNRLATASTGIIELTGPGSDPGVPSSLVRTIQNRLRFLSTPAIGVLRIAALLGSQFRVVDLGAALNQSAAQLANVIGEALSAGVLEESGAELEFSHPLVRWALYDGLSPMVRSTLHAQVARALERTNGAPERIAAHIAAADLPADPWTIAWIVSAAPQLSRRAPQLSAELLSRAADALDEGDPRRAMVLLELATVLFIQARFAEVEDLARPLLSTTTERAVFARLAWTLGYALLHLTRGDEALTVIEDAISRLDAASSEQARLVALQALVLLATGRRDVARAAAEEAQILAEASGDGLAHGYALHVMSMLVLQDDDYATGLALIERALAHIPSDVDGIDLRLLLLTNRVVAIATDRESGAIRDLLVLAERAANPVRHAAAGLIAAETWSQRGRKDDSLAELELVTEVMAGQPGILWMRYHALAARLAAERDDWSTVADHLRLGTESAAASGAQQQLYETLLVDARGLEAEHDGGPAAAIPIYLAACRPDAISVGSRNVVWLPHLAAIAMDVGDAGALRTALEFSADAASHNQEPRLVACAEHCRALAERDLDAIRRVARRYQDLVFPVEAALAMEDLAVLSAAAGDLGSARAAFGEALAGYEQAGARWFVRRAGERLRPFGIRRPLGGARSDRPQTGWDALTTTELRVAELVAGGAANADIAAALFVSPRTVQTHVSHILAKLNGRSRVEIAREFLQRQRA